PPSAALSTVSTSPWPTSTFIGRLESDTAGVMTAEGSGIFANPQPATPVSTAPVSTLTGSVPGGWPPGLTYRSDSKTDCCQSDNSVPPIPAQMERCTGIWTMNAFQPVAIPADPDPPPQTLSATFYDVIREQIADLVVDVDFSSVGTSGATLLQGMAVTGGNFA